MPRALPPLVVRVLREGAVVLFFLALATVATRPLVLDLRDRTLAGPDPIIDMWTVHWLSGHALRPADVFGGNVFHPDPSAVLYSDLSLGTAVLVVPLRAFVDDPVVLYNLGLLLALAFAGWAFCALVRERTGSLWGGLLAGVLAAFGSHQMSHLYHLNLLSTGWIGLFLLALERLMTRPGGRPALLAAVSFALSAQSSGYYAVATALLALVFAAARWRAFRDRRVLAAAAGAALLGAVLLAPYARAFLALRGREGLRRPPGMSVQQAFQPARDLGSRAYAYRRILGSEGERMFPGVLTLGLAGVALARRRPWVGFGAGAVGVLLVVSLGPRLEVGGATVPLPYGLLFAVPPLDNMRHPYTFAAVAAFLLAVLAGIGFASLRVAARAWAGPLVVLAAVLETLGPPPELRRLPRVVPPAYALLEALPPGPVLEVPPFSPETLVWAARHGRPTVNGIGAFAPAQTLRLERYVQNHWLKRVPADVDRSPPAVLLAERFPLRWVILPAGRRPAAFRPLARAFETSKAFALVAEADDGDRIYEFRREAVRLSDGGEGREEPGEVLGEDGQAVGHEQ